MPLLLRSGVHETLTLTMTRTLESLLDVDRAVGIESLVIAVPVAAENLSKIARFPHVRFLMTGALPPLSLGRLLLRGIESLGHCAELLRPVAERIASGLRGREVQLVGTSRA